MGKASRRLAPECDQCRCAHAAIGSVCDQTGLQRFWRLDRRQVPAFPVAETEVRYFRVSGVQKRLSRTGSPPSTPAIERNLSGFWEIFKALVDLIHGDVNGVRNGAGLLDFFGCADVYDHQILYCFNFGLQVWNRDS